MLPFFNQFIASFFQTQNALWEGTYDSLSDKFGGNASVSSVLSDLSPVSLCEMRGERYILEIVSLRGSALTFRLLVV